MNTEKQQTTYPLHYGNEAEIYYSYYKIPKVFFTDPELNDLSTDAKILYGIMVERMQLSMKNNWLDKNKNVYIYCTIENVMEFLNCGNKKAGRVMAELDDKDGVGLITRVHQGFGKPDRIYVHKCIATPNVETTPKECQNDMEENVESTSISVSKQQRNNTEYSNTEYSKTKSINPDRCDENNYELYRKFFEKQLDYDCLLCDQPGDQDLLTEILELLVDTVCSQKQSIRIAKEDKPIEVVKSRLFELNMEHIRYVVDCLKNNTTEVHNIRQYMLAMLYNAPTTMTSYYQAKVNHDLYGKKE